jgi:non-ribosomal peptide synthetase component F
MPAITELSFNASLRRIFAPLLRGNEVLLLVSNITAEPDVFVRAVCERGNVAINCLSSLWKTLLDSTNPKQAIALAQRGISGEVIRMTTYCPTLRGIQPDRAWILER